MPTDLTGLWTFGPDDYQLDDRAADQEGHTDPLGVTAPHGTYVKKLWYRIYHTDDTNFYIFDENGEFQHFEFLTPAVLVALNISPKDFRRAQMPEVWLANGKGLEFNLPKGDNYAPNGKKGLHFALLRLLAAENAPTKWCPGVSKNRDDQFIYFNEENQRIYWLPRQPDPKEEGLEFLRFEPQAREAKAQKSDDEFGNIFKTTELPQLICPFYGYNPCAKGFGSKAANLWSGLLPPGTARMDYTKSNPGMTIDNALLFEFPALESQDHRAGFGLPGQPRLPLGLEGKFVSVKWEHAHTEDISSTFDLTRSWSTTLGFNAGIKKMMTLSSSESYGNEVTNQKVRQERYTISRAVTVMYVFRNDVPNSLLQKQFVDEVHSHLSELLAGSHPRWENFTNIFGTHYVHAMTHGSIECALTRWSLAGELAARTKQQDFGIVASGALDGAKAGGETKFRDELKKSLNVEFHTEDVDRYSIGSDAQPVAIFFDLRPITELLNPVFIPYNPVDAWEKYSPFIWYDLRESLSRHLAKLGLNQPLERSFGDDFTPRLVKLTSPAAEIRVDNHEPALSLTGMHVTGSVGFEQIGPDPKDPYVAQKGDREFNSELVDEGHYKADERLFCLIATRRGQQAKVKMKITLRVYDWEKPFFDAPPTNSYPAVFSAERVLTEDVDTVFPNQVQADTGAVYYTMNFDLKWEEVPWG